MASLLSFVFSVGGLVVGLLLVVGSWRLRSDSARLRRGLFCLAVGCTLATIYAVPYAMSRLLVYGYRTFSASDIPAGRVAIVVLGYGESAVRDWDRRVFPVIDRVSMSRIAEALRVYQLIPGAWVISSGGGLSGEPPAAEVMRDVLMRHGVPESRIQMERESQSTREEAVLIAPMLRSLQIERVILVTSATHMRRSVRTFRAEGFEVIPAIANDPRGSVPWYEWILPGERGLSLSRAIAHEIAGILAYRVRYGV